MGHLTPEQLVDLAEATSQEASSPHLQVCEDCRQQLAGMKAMLSSVRESEAAEPSPLFWDHLSARVSHAIEAESAGTGLSWWPWLARRGMSLSWRVLAPAALAIAVAVVVIGTTRLLAPTAPRIGGAPPAPRTPGIIASTAATAPPVDADDASLGLVADLAASLDVEDALQGPTTTRVGGAEEAIGELTDDELRELQRLLKSEIGRSGA
jgi:hypothetical protein